MADRIIRLRPYFYIHVNDSNTNITRVVTGPQTFIRRDQEEVVEGPTPMISIPPRSYCVVANPHERDLVSQTPLFLESGQVRLRHGETEVRLNTEWGSPFPLYPGEVVEEQVKRLEVVKVDCALRLYALRDFLDGDVERAAGSEWLFLGPGTFIPRKEILRVEQIAAVTIKPNEALKLRARRALVDSSGTQRRAGDTWLVREQGSYLRGVEEEDLGKVQAVVLTEKTALHLRAVRSFRDVYGKERLAGDEWLVTSEDRDTHIPAVDEEIVREKVHKIHLSKSQYCVVVNPVDPATGTHRYGTQELRTGEAQFFLLPGESLLVKTDLSAAATDVPGEAAEEKQSSFRRWKRGAGFGSGKMSLGGKAVAGRPRVQPEGIYEAEVLGEEEALLLRAREEFLEVVPGQEEGIHRLPGTLYMHRGPSKYIPPVEVEILERRARIPLDESEGVYVRDRKEGTVRTVKGNAYMLLPNEELWEKELPQEVERLLASGGSRSEDSEAGAGRGSPRVKHKMVTYRVPHNHAVQLYDFKRKVSRVVYGPDLVSLEPEEQFTIISLSGGPEGEPKRPNWTQSVSLKLGPDFINDSIIVETCDHAKLELALCYNWVFDSGSSQEERETRGHKLFSVRDFVGDTCKAIASRIRGAVAAHAFDDFHKNSPSIIRSAVFGVDRESGEPASTLRFEANCLVVTNVDIQQVEPVEQKTLEALQGSVQLAIKIGTDSREAIANHEAAKEEQIAKGNLDRQRIRDRALAEEQRKELVELEARTKAAQSTGQAKAEAISNAESALIKSRAEVKQANLRADAARIRYKARLESLKKQQEQEREHRRKSNQLELKRLERETEIEIRKTQKMIEALGTETIEAIARAGPELQAQLLEGLGLQGYLVTDGSSPINLFNTASGLLGGGDGAGAGAAAAGGGRGGVVGLGSAAVQQ